MTSFYKEKKMSNYLENEILNTFIENLKDDSSIPKELFEHILKLKLDGKISKQNSIKNIIDDFTKKESENNEDKEN